MLSPLGLPSRHTAAFGFLAAITGVLIIFRSLPLQSPRIITNSFDEDAATKLNDNTTFRVPSLPEIYLHTVPKSIDCEKRLGPSFIEHASKTLVNYCTEASSSSLYCFRPRPSTEKMDQFCVGTSAVLDRDQLGYKLGCSLGDLTEKQRAAGIPAFGDFPDYWYETGPRAIFSKHIGLDPQQTFSFPRDGSPRNFTIIVRREAAVHNLFHHLMQIFSLYLTLDIMQTTRDPRTGNPLYGSEDYQNTRVVIFDDHEDGPFYEQWAAFGKRPLIRKEAFIFDSDTATEEIIVPLPGSANIFWQVGPVPSQCKESKLLQVFSQRILDFHSIKDESLRPDRPLVLTFIDRTGQRSLVNKRHHIEALKLAYPKVEINLVDFASLSLADQFRTVRQTDILAGVHGAGLTHSIFLRSPSAIVEILPPDLIHKSFRNIANVLGHRYYTTHATEHPNYTTPGGWHSDNIFIEQNRFIDLMGTAIKSMYQRGLLNDDVN